MGSKPGKDCAVKLGSDAVVGMGTWNYSGLSAAELDDTEFGDEWAKFKFGILNGGQVTFNGLCHPDDVTGQDVLKKANINKTEITNLRLYVDNTSYLEPCQTTGYFSPSDTSGNDTELSYVNVTTHDMSADKSGLMQTSFSCKVSGCMVLV